MKAIIYTQYGSPDVLQYKDVEKPTPKDHEVLVKIHAASANPLDWRLMRATPFLARLENGLFKPKQTKLGADIAGQVEAVGSSVTQFQPGDAVFGDIWLNGLGGFAEYGCTREDTLVLKPTNISFEAAAAVPLAGLTALQGLRDKGQIRPGQKVLINGASGGVGTFAVQIAKSFGAEVTGVCSTRNLNMVCSIGADHVIDYTQEDFTANGQQYDLIYCAVGNHSITDYKRALKPQGVCVIAGFSTLRLMFEHLILGPRRSKADGQRVGMMGTVKPNKADLTFLRELLEAGKVVPVIDRCYPLHETAAAIRYLEAGHAKGKVVVTVAHHDISWQNAALHVYAVQSGRGFMKAIVWTQYGSPDVLQLQEVERPAPKDDEVLIRIVATTVTSGDCEMRGLSGLLWYTLLMRAYVGLRKPKRITILGMELAGEIEIVGKEVKRFKPGDQVFAATGFVGLGTYTEYKCLPEEPEGGVLLTKPANMTYAEAAAVPVGGLEALHFLRRGNVQSGQKVLINGAGGTIGTFAVQLAKHFGAEVTSVDSTGKLEMLRSIGADHVVDYTQENYARSGETYDVILDVIGRSSFSGSLKSLKQDGRYLLANPRLSQMVRGWWTSRTSSKKVIFGTAGLKMEDLAFLKELIEAGKIKSVIDRCYPLEQTAEAHRYVETGHKKGHVVITVGQ